MRICFLDDSLLARGTDAVNGARVQILALARELMDRGHEVTVLSGSDAGEETEQPRDYRGIPVLLFPRPFILPFLGAVAASRAVRRLAPDIVYVRGRSYLAGVAAWEHARRGTGFVWASNAEEGCERWKQMRHLWAGPRPLARKLLRTPPDFLADLICDFGVRRAGAHVCQTEHQLLRLQAVYGKEGRIIRSLQLPPPDPLPRVSPPLVVWVGRVSAERHPEAFVDLAGGLINVDCDQAMVGPGASPAYLEQVLAPAAGLGRFRYVGEVSLRESWDWIAKATVLVNTSPVEGVSNALVQAWHCGTPTVVLSFDPDGIVERAGVGFKSGDLMGMVRDVRRLVADRGCWEAMSMRAAALAAREFSGESVGDDYEALMRRLSAPA